MKKIIAFQIDTLSSLKLKTDSSLLIAAELQSRGYKLFFYQVINLSINNRVIFACGAFVDVLHDHTGCRYEVVEDGVLLDLAQVSLVMIRQDPPFNMEYITSTYILERLRSATLVLNNPASIRDLPEKLSVLNFAEFLPSFIISGAESLIRAFIDEHREVVLKPLYQHGGNDIVLVNHQNYEETLREHLAKFGHIIAQKFIVDVMSCGDKRVIFAGDEIVGVFRRLPQGGDFRANTVVGGKVERCKLTDQEMVLCGQIGLLFKERGVILGGIDILNQNLIEINITSPTGLYALNELYGGQHEIKIADAIERKMKCDIS